MARREFTPDEDAYIVRSYSHMTLLAMAAHLGRRRACVQGRVDILIRQGRLDRTRRCYHRPWSEDDEEWLSENWGRFPVAECARHLHRSVNAVHIRAERFCHVNQHMVNMDSRQVGEIMGVECKLVVKWIGWGLLAGCQSYLGAGGNHCWAVSEDALQEFIREQSAQYDWRRIADPWYRRLAQSVYEADPWLTTAEAAAILNVDVSTLGRHFRRGWLPAVKTHRSGNNGSWMVRRSALAQFRLRGCSQTVLSLVIGRPGAARIARAIREREAG